MDDDVAELASYYEAEARAEARGAPKGRRVELRDTYVERLIAQGCRSVVDIGAGPATDGAAFTAAGLVYVGIDLAIGNARLAGALDLTVIPGSLLDPPFRSASFDAGYSMSTLQHVPDRFIGTALREIARILRPGAPLAIGLWGGVDDELWGERGTVEGRRLFRLRTDRQVRDLVGDIGEIDHFETFGGTADTGWSYQFLTMTVT